MSRRYAWIVVAVALLGVVAWLMPSANPERKPEPSGFAQRRHTFPDKPTPADLARMKLRRTQPVPSGAAGAGAAAGAMRDPFLAALPPHTDYVVLDISAFVASPLGRVLSRCDKTNQQLGIAAFALPMFDRFGVAGEDDTQRVILYGGGVADYFEKRAKARRVAVPYGKEGRIYPALAAAPADPKHPGAPAADASSTTPDDKQHVGFWRDELVVMSPTREQVERAIDRIEGRSPLPLAVAPDDAYSPIYGEVVASRIAGLTPRNLRPDVERSSMRVRFHIDPSEDVLIAAHAFGSPDAATLGQQLAAYLAELRVGIAAAGDKRYADLIADFSVEMENEGFKVNLGLPARVIKDALGSCAEDSGSAGSAAP